jgi:hypothetical protein
LRFDNHKISKFEDTNGFLKVSGFAAKTGVLEYQSQNEYVPADTLFSEDSMNGLRGVPVTLGHPSDAVTPKNYRGLSVGTVISVAKTDSGVLEVELSIADESAIDKIKGGTIELSCGYNVEIVRVAGRYDNTDYQVIQRNRIYNHIALVDHGRAGSRCKLNLDNKGNNMATVILPSGAALTVEDSTVASAISSEFSRLDSEVSQMSAIKDSLKESLKANEILKARADELEDTNKELTKRNDEDSISPIIKLIDQCKRLDAKFDPFEKTGKIKSSHKMRLDALAVSGVNFLDKEPTEAYIEARMDIKLESLGETETNRQQQSCRKDSSPEPIEMSPRDKFIKQQEANRYAIKL